MNWEAIGAIGQAVSALALVIVIVQVRHARSEMQRSLVQGRSAAMRELFSSRANNTGLLRSRFVAHTEMKGPESGFVAALTQRTSLTSEEAYGLSTEEFAWWTYRLGVIAYVEQLPRRERAEFERGLRFQFGASPITRLWYQTTKGNLDPDAVRYIDNLLATQPG
jgi:hypothetical protein